MSDQQYCLKHNMFYDGEICPFCLDELPTQPSFFITVDKEKFEEAKTSLLETIEKKKSSYYQKDMPYDWEEAVKTYFSIKEHNGQLTLSPSVKSFFSACIIDKRSILEIVNKVITSLTQAEVVLELHFSDKYLNTFVTSLKDIWNDSLEVEIDDETLQLKTKSPLIKKISLECWIGDSTQVDSTNIIELERPMFWLKDIEVLTNKGFKLKTTDELTTKLNKLAEEEKQRYFFVSINPYEEGIQVNLYKHIAQEYKDRLEKGCSIKYWINKDAGEYEELKFIERKFDLDVEKTITYVAKYFTFPVLLNFFKKEGFNVEVDKSLFKQYPKLDFKMNKNFKLYDIQQPAIDNWYNNTNVGTVVIPTGGGKSVKKGTLITYSVNGRWKIDPIETIVDKYFSSDEEGTKTINNNIFVPSFNTKTQKIAFQKVSAVSRHYPTKKMVILKTKSGRHLSCTTDHNFLTINSDGISLKDAKNLKIGDSLPIAIRLPKIQTSKKIDLWEFYQNHLRKQREYRPFKDLDVYKLNIDRQFIKTNYYNQYNKTFPRYLILNKSISEFFGWCAAEGNPNNLTQFNQPNLERIVNLMDKGFTGWNDVGVWNKQGIGFHRHMQPLLNQLIDYSIPLSLELLKTRFKGIYAKRKIVPYFLFDSDLAFNFVKGLVHGDGEGDFSNSEQSSCISSSSRKLLLGSYFLGLISTNNWLFTSVKKDMITFLKKPIEVNTKGRGSYKYSKYEITPKTMSDFVKRLHFYGIFKIPGETIYKSPIRVTKRFLKSEVNKKQPYVNQLSSLNADKHNVIFNFNNLNIKYHPPNLGFHKRMFRLLLKCIEHNGLKINSVKRLDKLVIQKLVKLGIIKSINNLYVIKEPYKSGLINRVKKDISILHPLINGDLMWDEIISIDYYEPKKNEFVYDFSVPRYENFMLSNGLFVHNTIVGLELISQVNEPTLIIVPTIEIKNQWYEFLTGYEYVIGKKLNIPNLGIPREYVGEFFGGKKEIKPITIALFQSAHKGWGAPDKDHYSDAEITEMEKFGEVVGKLSEQFGLFIVDEGHHLCFTGDVPVSVNFNDKIYPVPIKEIVEKRLPMEVFSYNAKKGIVESKPITDWFKITKPSKKLAVTVKDFNNKSVVITCTPDHIFYTTNGLVKAANLNPGDSLYKISHKHLVYSDSPQAENMRKLNKIHPSFLTKRKDNLKIVMETNAYKQSCSLGQLKRNRLTGNKVGNWTKDEITFLEENKQMLSAEKIAKSLNRSLRSVIGRLQFLDPLRIEKQREIGRRSVQTRETRRKLDPAYDVHIREIARERGIKGIIVLEQKYGKNWAKIIGAKANPEKIRKSVLKWYSIPKNKRKWLNAIKRHPNKLELLCLTQLIEFLPDNALIGINRFKEIDGEVHEVDIVIKTDNVKIAVFCDGDAFHGINTRKSDNNAVIFFNKLGYNCLRLKSREIYDRKVKSIYINFLKTLNKGEVKNRLIDWTTLAEIPRLEDPEVISVTDLGMSNEPVYCIEVADNHNFFANNVLVSNCAPLWKKVAINLKSFKRMSLTATPERYDGNEPLLFFTCGDVIHSVTYEALAKKKIVCPIKFERIFVPLTENENRILELLASIKGGRFNGWHQKDKLKQAQQELMELYLNHPYIQMKQQEFIERATKAKLKGKNIGEFLIKRIQIRIIHLLAQNKFKELTKILKKHKHSKALIFNEYIYGTRLIHKHLENNDIYSEVLTGSTPGPQRELIFKDFRESVSGIIETTTVLDEGINVPDCNVAIIFNGRRRRRQMIQRIGRACRYKKYKIEYAYELVVEPEQKVKEEMKEALKIGQTVYIIGGSFGKIGEECIVEKFTSTMADIRSVKTGEVYDKYIHNISLSPHGKPITYKKFHFTYGYSAWKVLYSRFLNYEYNVSEERNPMEVIGNHDTLIANVLKEQKDMPKCTIPSCKDKIMKAGVVYCTNHQTAQNKLRYLIKFTSAKTIKDLVKLSEKDKFMFDLVVEGCRKKGIKIEEVS